MTLPAIDAHAHIRTTVPARDLSALDAFVVAVTRERTEWTPALRRQDDLAVWGVGVHPGLPEEIRSFDPAAFADVVEAAVFVGEVGLDGRSRTALSAQRTVFEQILEVLGHAPRPTTIHSVSATRAVLDALKARPIPAPILHWWRGSQRDTEEAIEMGCFFSVNGAEAKRPKVLSLLPPDRVLTETDFPYSRRADSAASRPAAVATIERELMRRWGVSELELRRRLWRNLAELCERCAVSENLPRGAQEAILTAGLG